MENKKLQETASRSEPRLPVLSAFTVKTNWRTTSLAAFIRHATDNTPKPLNSRMSYVHDDDYGRAIKIRNNCSYPVRIGKANATSRHTIGLIKQRRSIVLISRFGKLGRPGFFSLHSSRRLPRSSVIYTIMIRLSKSIPNADIEMLRRYFGVWILVRPPPPFF